MDSVTYKNNIKSCLLAVTMLEAPIFFSLLSLFGQTYEGSESSPIYKIFMASMLIIQIFLLFSRWRISISLLVLLCLPLLFISVAWITSLFYYENYIAQNVYLYIILWQYTGILTAINLFNLKNSIDVVKWLRILMLVITISSIISIIIPFLTGGNATYSISGSTSQASSYHISLAAGLNIHLNILDPPFRNKSKKILLLSSYILLIIQVIAAILCGGRGAMIVILAYVFCALFSVGTNNYKVNRRKNIFFVFVLLACVVIYVYAENNIVLSERLDRVFSYITPDGIDMSKTSNRDIVYSNAIYHINKSPIIGHGIYSYYYLEGLNRYPHNFFLEVLLEGGYLYLLFWLLLIIITFFKLNNIRKKHILNVYRICVVFFIFAVTKLMFSSSYSYEMLFWFGLTYIWLNDKAIKNNNDVLLHNLT